MHAREQENMALGALAIEHLDEDSEALDAVLQLVVRAEANGKKRLFVNDERNVLVDLWPDGTVTVATRTRPDEIWGPPVYLKEEK